MFNLVAKNNIPNFDELIPYIPSIKGIPKIIHQTHRTKNISGELLDNINWLKHLNPSWEHRLYDDNDIKEFIAKYYGNKILSYYKKITPTYGAAKADFFRYLLMYKYGGVYLDIKSSLTKSLNNTLLPNDQLILSHWDNEDGRVHENWGHYKEINHITKGEYQQWHIIAGSGHPFLRQMIIQVLKNIHLYNPYKAGVGLKGTLITTGPIAYSLLIDKLCKTSSNFRLVDGVNEIGLIYSIYEKEFGCYHHKQALNSNYNYQIEPVIDNGFKQDFLYRLYFNNFYKHKIKYEQKFDIIYREMKRHPNKISSIKFLLKKILS